MAKVLERRLPGSLTRELADTVAHLNELVAAAAAEPAGAKV